MTSSLKTIQFRSTFYVCFCIVTTVQGQPLTRGDFALGFLKIEAPVDSIVAHLGQPKKTRRNDIQSEYIALDYRKLVVWLNEWDKRVCGFDIYTRSYVTRRGLRIGDSLSVIKRLYGEPNYEEKEFDRLGPYDFGFHDYSQVHVYQVGDFHCVLFTKGKRLVRMLFYMRPEMTDDDFTVGFLKLASPFDSLATHLGKPDSTVEGDFGSTGFYYPKLVVWRDNESNTLCAFDIYDSTYVTHRGLRVGDSKIKVEQLYGHGDYGIQKDIHRVGPYDYTFKDYSEVYIVEYGYFLVLFIKDSKLVKILSYVGVYE